MNNENNNDIYQEDNGFNNQGIVDSPDTTQPVEQQTQFPSAAGEMSKLGNMAQGLPGQLRKLKNNPALGLPNKKNKKDQEGDKNKDNKNKNNENNKNNPNNNNKENKNNNERNPLPGGTNKKDNSKENQNKKNNEKNNKQKKNKKGVLGALNPNSIKRGIASRIGMGLKNKESGSEETSSTQTKMPLKINGSKIVNFFLKYKAFAFGAAAFVLISILFVALISALSGIFESAIDSSSSYCGGDSYDLSVLDDPKVSYTYTGAFAVTWSPKSNQLKTLKENNTYMDEDGFLRSGDAYFIALGSYFGIEKDGKKELVMGTKYLIKLKNGTEFVGILADAKSDKDTTESSKHAQHNKDKSVIEFEMACGGATDPKKDGFNFKGEYLKKCDTAALQKKINSKFSGEIESISLNDDSGASCETTSGLSGGSGDFPIRTKYFTDAEMERIFKASKAARTAKKLHPWECPTYARMRAVEILLDAKNISDEYRNKAIAAINGTTGNGGDWWAPHNSGLKNFGYDTSCTKPKSGSIISWKSNSIYGHVGIIEAVKGDKVIVTDGYNKSHFNKHELTVNGAAHIYGYKKCYGITYLFEYKG